MKPPGEPERGSEVFALQPAVSDKALAPLWFVKTTAEQGAANVAWQWCDVQALVGFDLQGSVAMSPPASRSPAMSPP